MHDRASGPRKEPGGRGDRGMCDVKTPRSSRIGEDAVVRAAYGDVDAFRELYDAYAADVFRYGMLQTDSREVAEDILQETMIAIWRGRERLSSVANVCSWVMAIARNKTIDYIRAKPPTVSMSDFGDASEPGAAGVSTQASRPTGPLEDAIPDRVDLAAALIKLDLEKRELLYMVFYMDMSYNEVASVLGVPAGTVKSRMYFARRQLQEILERGCRSCQSLGRRDADCGDASHQVVNP